MKSKAEQQDRAVAVEYKSLDELPRITAAGVGAAAREILKLAEEHNVPIHQDGELLKLMEQVSPGAVIDSRTFRLMAEVISFLYSVDKEWRTDHAFLHPVLGESPTLLSE